MPTPQAVDRRRLVTQPIPGLVREIAVPASVGYFFSTMYNVVDTWYGGLISTDALAAMSLTFSVFFLIIATGSGLSTGATALIGAALGGDRDQEAEVLAVQGLTFGVLTALGLTVFGWLASPFLFRVLGAEGAYLGLAVEYMRVIFCGAAFFILNHMLNAICQAQGATRPFRNFLIAGFALNIGLDPLFIFGIGPIPGLGFSGIALATVLIQFLGCFYMAHEVRKTGLLTGAARGYVRPRGSVFKEIARQGFPAALNMLTIGVGIFVITYYIGRFGKEGVAAYGAAMRVEQIVLLPTIGLNVAALTLTAQNYGGLHHDRIWETLRKCLFYGAVIMIPGAAAVFALSGTLMHIFTNDPAVIDIGAVYLKIDALVLYAYVILFVHVAALQGIKRPMYAIWIGLFRQVLAPLAVFHLLAVVWGWELLGVWWGIFIVTWAAAIVTIVYARFKLKKVFAAET
jgi:putative MATE family efflux protein